MESALYLLVVLVCPVAMALMMWLMMRRHPRSPSPSEAPSLAELRERQKRLGAEIDRLEGLADVERSGEGTGEGPTRNRLG